MFPLMNNFDGQQIQRTNFFLEEIVNNCNTIPSSDTRHRHVPSNKKPDAAPTFPEKMMELMRYVEQQANSDFFCIAWMPDGKSIIIRDVEKFTCEVVPKFFKPTKFASFTRKLYRWGFRQLNRGAAPEQPLIFGSDNFQRYNESLIANMRSKTAAAVRKEQLQQQQQQKQCQQEIPTPVKFSGEGAFVTTKRQRDTYSTVKGFDVDESNHKRMRIEPTNLQRKEEDLKYETNGASGLFFPSTNLDFGSAALMDELRPNPISFSSVQETCPPSIRANKKQNTFRGFESTPDRLNQDVGSFDLYADLPNNILRACMAINNYEVGSITNVNDESTGASNHLTSWLSEQLSGLTEDTTAAKPRTISPRNSSNGLSTQNKFFWGAESSIQQGAIGAFDSYDW